MNTMVFVLLLAFFSLHHGHPARSDAFDLMNMLCTNGSSYGLNSTYHSNVVSLLGSLSADASNSTIGFATGTTGRAPDHAWGLALCRVDVNGTGCASCLALARCLLRYSDEDFLASPDDHAAAPVQYDINLELNTTGDPGQFVGLAADLVGALSGWAARNSTSRYAAGAATSAELFTTTDHAPEACQGCLGRLRFEMPAAFNGTTGAQFNLVWSKCNLIRYEVYPSYDGTPAVKLVAPGAEPASKVAELRHWVALPSTLAPAGASGCNDGSSTTPPAANRTGWAGNTSAVFATVLGVLAAILLSTFTVYLSKKPQANQDAEEGDHSRSLLFDLTTLITRKAAVIFAEENEVVRAGFVAAIIYKVLLLPDGAHTHTVAKMARQVGKRSVRVACVLLLSLSSISLLPSAGAAADLVTWRCDNGTYYAANSTYQSNVRRLLASLAANASRSPYPAGFATAAVGSSPDAVWGLALCRGDTTGAACGSCLALAPEAAFSRCQGVKDVTLFYDRCTLRYSFRDFLTSPDNGEVQDRGVSSENVTSNAGGFNALVVRLVGALSDWAAFNTTSRYAVGVMSSDQVGFPAMDKGVVHRIMGLVQCTPDQAPAACRRCLQALIDEMPTVFNGTVGGRLLAVWCYLRFEVHEFYDSSPMLNLVAPSWSPPPSPAPADQNQIGGNGTRWRQYAATVSAIILGVTVLLLSIFMFFLWRNGRSRLFTYQEDEDPDASLLFDLPTLRQATGNFAEENKLGHGGFGAVYKGLLPDGRQIAMKRMDKASGQGLKELRNELLLVVKLRHNHLAKLLGVCLHGDEKLLVYEYLPNRSLDTFLFAAEIEKRLLLDWETRYRIIYGTARGLLYLHEDSQIKIIHRDLKASNILLDGDMSPKISDFGLARLFNGDKTTTITSQVVGTLGYMAPEYAVLGHLSVKLDVYSFGVLILEIVTGRKNTDMSESAVDESGNLLTYVWDHWLKGTTLNTMDPSMDCRVPESEVLKCIHLGLLCVQENPADRPTMLDVIVMLHDQTAANFAAPSKPAFAFAYGERTSVGSRDDTGTQRGAAATLLSYNEMSVSSEFEPR